MPYDSPPGEPIPELPDGLYLAKILYVEEDDLAFKLILEIVVGRYAGYGTAVMGQTKFWPLQQRIDKKRGQAVIGHILKSVNVSDIHQAVGHQVCLELQRSPPWGYQCRRWLPAASFKIKPEDIRLGNGSWASGSPERTRADIMGEMSGLPTIFIDTRERGSPMIDWCAEHNIILVPEYFLAGDYWAPGSQILVDRKNDLTELCENFTDSNQRSRYNIAAAHAAAKKMRLVYVIATSPTDHVSCLDDLVNWSGSGPHIRALYGPYVLRQIIECQKHHPNTHFVFVDKNLLCETICQLLLSDDRDAGKEPL